MLTIQDLLHARAVAMAAHDGTAAGPVHIHGAANLLQADLVAARDALIRRPVPLPAPAAAGDQPEAAPEPPAKPPRPVARARDGASDTGVAAAAAPAGDAA